MASKAFNIKWKKHGDHCKDALSNYLKKQILCDVTLTSEGKFFKAHQIVLASCSKYFENIFLEIPTNSYPVVILKDVTALEIELLLSCIYKGEVDIPEDLTATFLKTCETLKIEGFYTHVDENDDVFHSLQKPQNSAEVGNRYKDLYLNLKKTTNQIMKILGIESQKNKQTSVLNSPPIDSQKSFVFTLNESANIPKTTADFRIIIDESIIIEESQAEVMEISDEDANEDLKKDAIYRAQFMKVIIGTSLAPSLFAKT